MSPIAVPYRKGTVLLIFVGAMVVLAVSTWILMQPSARVSVQGALAAWICIPFSIIVGAFAFSRLCSRKPALIIDEKGITDHASGVAVGFVPWDDIAGAGIAEHRTRRFLGIAVRNSGEYLAKAGWLKRMLMKSNQRALGYVINVPQAALSVSVEKLLNHINEYRQSSLP